MKDTEEAIQIPLAGGGTYGLMPRMTEQQMHNLATSILSHLGRSYDIKVPGSTGWGGRSQVLAKMRADADAYAERKTDDPDEFERLSAAYRQGWNASPKPVSYPVQRHTAR